MLMMLSFEGKENKNVQSFFLFFRITYNNCMYVFV